MIYVEMKKGVEQDTKEHKLDVRIVLNDYCNL